MSWNWQLYLYLSRYAGCANSNHTRHFNLIEQSVRSSWEISWQPYRGYTATNRRISLLATALEDALLCWGSFYQSRRLPLTLFLRMRGSRLLRHGTALYCTVATPLCVQWSQHTLQGRQPSNTLYLLSAAERKWANTPATYIASCR